MQREGTQTVILKLARTPGAGEKGWDMLPGQGGQSVVASAVA